MRERDFTASSTMRFVLEIEPGSEPIRGSLAAERGAPTAFHGWMEFAAILQVLIERPAASDPGHGQQRSS